MDRVIELLLDQEESLKLIGNLASYIIYMYPGVISIYEMSFLEARNPKETNAFWVKMFAISYVYNIILGYFIEYNEYQVYYNILLLIISFVTPFIVYKIKYSEPFSWICQFLGIRTCVTSVPFELLKDTEEDYTCLKVFLKESKYHYIGYMQNYEYEPGKDNYLILSGYIKAYIDENKEERVVLMNSEESYKEKVYLKYDEIEIIEKVSEESAKQLYEKQNVESKENRAYDDLWDKNFGFKEDDEYDLYKRIYRRRLTKTRKADIDKKYNIQSHYMWREHIKEKYCRTDDETLEEFAGFIDKKMLKHDSAIFSISTISGGLAGASAVMLFECFEMMRKGEWKEAWFHYSLAAVILVIFVVIIAIWHNDNGLKKRFYEECKNVIINTQEELKNK